MITINGKHNTSICYTSNLEEKAREQIQTVCDQEAFADCKIRIMPDVHAGMGCTIGTTMTITDKIVPGMVGVDIGCGMETVRIDALELDFDRLDEIIHKLIPAGFSVRNNPHRLVDGIDLSALRCAQHVKLDRAYKSIGTLGGGNHFIEVCKADSGELYIVVHSGSRHLGNEVAEYYQAAGYNALDSGGHMRDLPKDLAYVEGALFDDYVHDMKIIQRFAVLNRKAMMDVILVGMRLSALEEFTTIHNYIDTDSMILRKGAVSAALGEKLLIPINMRDGSLICVGKGNPDWNYSAPHGAGRLMSRNAAFKELSMHEYEAEMSNVYSTCVVPDTLDESPMAYKPIDEIISQITPTVDIMAQIKPLYNFKAAEKSRKGKRRR
ncbi:MAG: RtcB family protein [Defluviitaleaceae bacterium]|nr:RtcB family protein [Defluviitaleaceae bacterium]